MLKFKTDHGHRAKIEPVEVVRETAHFVVLVGGRKETKESTFDRHHDTWEAAHAYLTERAELKLARARIALQTARDFAGNVKGMKPPADAA